jgi:DNA-binding NarL/FixJ family response regulator
MPRIRAAAPKMGVSRAEAGCVLDGKITGHSLKLLSPRELMVVTQTAAGTPLKIVADRLSISVQAVSTYLGRARTKLGHTSRVGLAEIILGGRRSLDDFRSALATQLTSAELAVAETIVQGKSNADIALARGTSVRTVENQVSQLLSKLHVGSRAGLIASLYSKGWKVGKTPINEMHPAAPSDDFVFFPEITSRRSERR